MKAKELMDKKFVYISPEDSVKDVSITMEKIRRFTCPVVDDNKHLVGWVTSFEITWKTVCAIVRRIPSPFS